MFFANFIPSSNIEDCACMIADSIALQSREGGVRAALLKVAAAPQNIQRDTKHRLIIIEIRHIILLPK